MAGKKAHTHTQTQIRFETLDLTKSLSHREREEIQLVLFVFFSFAEFPSCPVWFLFWFWLCCSCCVETVFPIYRSRWAQVGAEPRPQHEEGFFFFFFYLKGCDDWLWSISAQPGPSLAQGQPGFTSPQLSWMPFSLHFIPVYSKMEGVSDPNVAEAQPRPGLSVGQLLQVFP